MIVDGYVLGDKPLKASYGMTKFCSYFLNQQKCLNKECLYLHITPHPDDIFTHKDKGSNKLRLRNSRENLFTYFLDWPARDIVRYEKFLGNATREFEAEGLESEWNESGSREVYADALLSPVGFMAELKERFAEMKGMTIYEGARIAAANEQVIETVNKNKKKMSESLILNSKKEKAKSKMTKSKKAKKKRVAIGRW